MDDDSTRQTVLFSDLLGKPMVAKFDRQHASSDGGFLDREGLEYVVAMGKNKVLERRCSRWSS